MAEIPSIKRFRSEDYPDIDPKFLANLNVFMETVVTAISGHLNTKNIAEEIYERVLIVKNTPVTPERPLKLPWTKAYRPSSLVCGGIWQRGADIKTSLGVVVTIDWDYQAETRQILIKRVNGITLPSGSIDYEITIQVSSK